jgi:peptidoglycan/LPS O-acetylase OafA/YrhL
MRSELKESMSGYTAAPPSEHRAQLSQRVDWLDPVKALALLAIMLNHLVEEFGPGPWFTNPGSVWPSLAVRLHTIIPPGTTVFLRIVRTAGWLGDSAPGVFILASGLGLTLSALARPADTLDTHAFYRRRLLRLYPLYIALHVVVLAGSLFVPGDITSFAGLRTAFSLTGIRLRSGLFFYISPSWWFVWLILQLYVVYPYLFRALRKLGVARFFLSSLVVTLAARGFFLRLPSDRYSWLTGRFFATRLAEFAAGMVLAQLIVAYRQRGTVTRVPSSPLTIFGGSLVCYALGLLASFTLAGALVSNLLVTIGMTGLFWSVWQTMLRPVPPFASSAQWLGRRSYAVFLLHQSPLQWTAAWFAKARVAHFFAALGALGISIPAAAAIEDAVARVMKWRPSELSLRSRRILAAALALAIVALTVFVVGPREPASTVARVGAWMCAVSLLALAIIYWTTHHSMSRGEWLLALTALLGGALELFAAPGTSGIFALGVGGTVACVAAIMQSRVKRMPLRALAAAAMALGCAAAGELALRRFAPLETGVWGELPALESHPTRAFALTPNRVTHLRYNKYDYTVRTNSLGLSSPEISVARPSTNTFRIFVAGDAFAMPEGIDYDRSFPAILGRELQRCLAPRPVQVINGGVTGYGPNEELAQLRELVPEFRPDVIVDQFYINEFSDIAISPANFRHDIGLDLAHRSFFDRIRVRSQLRARFLWMERSARESLNGRAAAWRYLLEQLDYYRAGENGLYDTVTTRLMVNALSGMKRTADSSGAQLLIAFVPGAVAVSDFSQMPHFPRGEDLHDARAYDLGRPYGALRRITDSLGIHVLDLTTDLKASAAQPTYFPSSWHWTPAGHRAAASSIERTLDTLGMLGAHCS